MSRNSDISQQSRRSFTKRFLAALASAPIAPSVINAQTPKKSTAKTRKRQSRTDHIPPLTLRGGSLTMELRHGLIPHSVTGSRTYGYIADGISSNTQYGQIAKVKVATEHISQSAIGAWTSRFLTDGFPRGTSYYTEQREAQLWLWFANRPYQSNDPHVVVSGGYPMPNLRLQTLRIECDEGFDNKEDPNSKRRYKYKHRGHHPNRDYRIREWRIVDGGGSRIEGGQGEENYIFLVEFHHGLV